MNVILRGVSLVFFFFFFAAISLFAGGRIITAITGIDWLRGELIGIGVAIVFGAAGAFAKSSADDAD